MADSFSDQFAAALESKLAGQAADRELAGAQANLADARATGELTTALGNQGAIQTYGSEDANRRFRGALSGAGATTFRAPSLARDFQRERSLQPSFSGGSSFGNSTIAGNSTGLAPAITDQTYKFAQGGLVPSPGDMKMNPLYQQYVKAMQNAGMGKMVQPPEAVIPRLAQQQAKLAQAMTKQAGMGYADGGEVDVGGAVVDGPGTGKSDSIPAMIDGETPAALSKGEFIFPKKVVDYYGTKFLDGMVQKAREAMKKQAISK